MSELADERQPSPEVCSAGAEAENPSLEDVMAEVIAFRSARNWTKTREPANISKSILIEAAELLEHFQWSDEGYDLDEVKYEIADVYIYLLNMVHDLDLNLNKLALEKLKMAADKYPSPGQDPEATPPPDQRAGQSKLPDTPKPVARSISSYDPERDVFPEIQAARVERGWHKLDSPANLAKSVAVESAELLEHFQWSDDDYDLEEVKHEMADVYTYLLTMAHYLNVNLDQAALDKLEIIRKRNYPSID